MTTLASLIQMGGFVSDELVKKTLTWPRKHLGQEDVTVDVWVRPMNTRTQEILFSSVAGDKLAAKLSNLAAFGDKGEERVSAEQVGLMDFALVAAISRAIDELGQDEGKD